MKLNMNIIVGVLLCFLVSSPAFAQLSKARAEIEKAKGIADDISGWNEKKNLDEAKVHKAASDLRDSYKTAIEAIKGFCVQLGASASGEVESKLKEPSAGAANLVILMGRTIESCEQLRELINLDPAKKEQDRSSYENKRSNLLLKLEVQPKTLRMEFNDLVKKTDELHKLLRESLKNAVAKRDDAAKPLAGLSLNEQLMDSKRADQLSELRSKFDTLIRCEGNEGEKSKKSREAIAAHDVARNAPTSASNAENAFNAYQKYLATKEEHREAAKRTYNAYIEMEKALVEGKSRLADLARLMNEIKRAAEELNPQIIAKRCVEYDQWIKMIDNELSR